MRVSLEVGLLTVAAVAGVATAGYFLWKLLRKPGDPEKARRLRIEAAGRIIDGQITDWRDGVVYYRWTWQGVEYHASQDLNGLEHVAQTAFERAVGPVSVKFLTSTPSNSIVLSENWSGFRTPPTNSSGLPI